MDVSRGSAYRASRTARGTGTRVCTPRRRPAGRLAAVLAIAVAALVVWAATCGASGAVVSWEASESTPVSAWRQGEMPYLYQTDPAWDELPYAGGTVGENGCGPTCLAMVYVYLTGRRDMGPVEMCRMSEEGGHTVDGMTAWTLMSEGASGLGLSSREVPADSGQVLDLLASGVPIIASMAPGDFTTTGHFIVLSGLAEDGGILVHDPNSAQRSGRTWDVETILSQARNLWAFSV